MNGETSHQEHIGPFRLLTRLGGGTGAVHRATGPDGRDVAIRLLPAGSGSGAAGSGPDIARMRGVLSPYVVDVLGGDPAADPPYLVSRLVPGRPLGDDVAERGPVAGAELRRVALGLAKALAAIHREGLVHGALGPGTVLIVDGSPVVVDFGLVPGAEAAGDVRAWAATVVFAATGDATADPAASAAVPGALRPLLLAASADDPAARPGAEELAAACAGLDLGPAVPPVPSSASTHAPPPVPQSAPPAGPPAGGPPVAATSPDPVPTVASASSEGSVAVLTEPGAETPAARPGPGADSGHHDLAATQGWARLLTATVVVIAVGVAVTAPVMGLVLSIAGVAVLRAAGESSARGRLSALGRTLLTLPYAAALMVAVPLVLVALSVVGGEIDALSACAFGAGAGAAVLWTGPGVRAPRALLERMFLPVARVPRRIAVAGVVLGALALFAVVAAMSLTPSFAPMYGLQSSLKGWIDQAEAALR
ncbi:hypothetical protein [Spirillospora sp. NBC_01491]|uniref:hypothetical protein n=1 Tax=Spirillospora sp. NBC_01491 TaxID=2976007 RepID=UPI002E3418E3|nr:hypothetical protein [Spirillospora sp. NBC_01491]